MTSAHKIICQLAAVLLLFTLTGAPAKAQFAGGGGGGGVGGAGVGDGIPGGYGGGIPGGYGGGDIMGMIGGGGGGGDMMGMIGPLMKMANVGGGHRRHRKTDAEMRATRLSPTAPGGFRPPRASVPTGSG